jgi:agmatine deiminase
MYRDGQRLPASYANFYIANGVVLLPTYDPERDEQARATLQALLPDREIIGIDCTDLVWGLGAFHCVTQQWPALSGTAGQSGSGQTRENSGSWRHG